MVETALIVVYAVVVIVFGFAVWFLAADSKAKNDNTASISDYVFATLAIKQTIEDLIFILTPKSGDAQVVAEDALRLDILCPFRTGWFWINGKPVNKTFINVKIPIGYVAQLNQNNDSNLYFESSRLVFISDIQVCDAGNSDASRNKFVKIQCLKRAETWTFKVNSTDGQERPVLSQELIPISAICTVQTRLLPVGLSQEDMEVVFNELENYRQNIQNLARGVLFDLAKNHTYDQLMQLMKSSSETKSSSEMESTPEILTELNKAWEVANNSESGKIHKICKSYFASVVISPLINKEYERIGRKIQSKQNTVERKATDNDNAVDATLENIRNPLVTACQDLQRDFARFGESLDVSWLVTGSDNPDKTTLLYESFKRGVESLVDQVKNQNEANDFRVKKVGEHFENGYRNYFIQPLAAIGKTIETFNSRLEELNNRTEELRNNTGM